jgi:hypothetical protein
MVRRKLLLLPEDDTDYEREYNGALADLQREQLKLAKTRIRLQTAINILKRLEWSAKVREDPHGGIGSDDGMTEGCPVCRGTKHMGHEDNCDLKTAIQKKGVK